MMNIPIATNSSSKLSSTALETIASDETEDERFAEYLDQLEVTPDSLNITHDETGKLEVVAAPSRELETDELVFTELGVFPYLKVELPPESNQKMNAAADIVLGDTVISVVDTWNANTDRLLGSQLEFVTPGQVFVSSKQDSLAPVVELIGLQQDAHPILEHDLASTLGPQLELNDDATQGKPASNTANSLGGGQVAFLTDQTDVVGATQQQSVLAPHKTAAMQVAAVFTAGLDFSKNQRVQTISLDLHPAELGHLKIHVQQTPDQLTAHIIASEATSTEMLLREKDFLLQALADLGFSETSLDISHGNGENSEADSDSSFAHAKSRVLEFEIKPEWKNHLVTAPGRINFIA